MDKTMEANDRQGLVHVTAGLVMLEGALDIPAGAHGIVLFAHGSGSSRFSPRNRAVAQTLRLTGLATLLIDLLTPDEEIIDVRGRGSYASTSPCWPSGSSVLRTRSRRCQPLASCGSAASAPVRALRLANAKLAAAAITENASM